MEISIRGYTDRDLPGLLTIWNGVVEDGLAFPQMETLDLQKGAEFFASQSFCGVAEDADKIIGLYILHPNNVGRCGHICNASYAVTKTARGLGIGEKLVLHSLAMGRQLGFRIMQFNAVARDNIAAHKLYTKIGFKKLGLIPEGFLRKPGQYEDIVLYYFPLNEL